MSFCWCWTGAAENRAIIALFAAVAAIKLFLLSAFGPVFMPDTAGYVEYAEQILHSTTWLHDAGLSSSATPITAIRMIGYPALIAAAMMIAGPSWPYLLVALQFVTSLAAGRALYRLGREFALPWQMSIAGAVAFMLSFQLTLDQTLLTDSLNASCLVIATCLLASGAVATRPLGAREAAVAGFLMAIAFLIREALQFLVAALLPLLAVRLWLAGRKSWRGSAVACGLVLAPLVVTVEFYKAWNFDRTGERFVTTISALTLSQAIAQAAKYDAAVIAGDTSFDRAAREQLRFYSYSEVVSINDALFAEGLKATDISRMVNARYSVAWRERPLAMLSVLRHNVSERAAKLTIRPLAAICETMEWSSSERRCYDYRDLYRSLPYFRGLPWTAPPFFVLQTIETAFAVTLFAGFMVGVPGLTVFRLLLPHRRVDAAVLAVASFWILYVGWFTAYGIVHFEDRYMMPVVPFSIVGGFYVFRELLLKSRARVKAKASA